MRQYHRAKARYPDAILFFHLGDFYETFFEDAELVARELEITLTQRDGHPMAGVPVRKADLYLHRLLRRGHKVALCQQVERPGEEKKLLRREVVRVLTPGTVLEEGALEAEQDTYLAAVFPDGERLGVAWAEAASGEFWAAELAAADLEQLAARISAKEWLLPAGWSPPLPLPGAHTARPETAFTAEPVRRRFPDTLSESPLACRAAGAVLDYLDSTVGQLPHLNPPRLSALEATMALDPFTQSSLELTAPLRPEGKHTVLGVLDRTKTPMGRRLLRRWLLAPLRDRRAVDARLDAVQALVEDARWQPLAGDLRRLCDLPRLLGRVGTGRLNPPDLVALRRCLTTAPQLLARLEDRPAGLPERLAAITAALAGAPGELGEEIGRALVEEPPPSPDQGGLIRGGYDPQLDELRARAKELRGQIAALEAAERERTGIPTLRVGYNRVLGYFLETTKAHLAKVPPRWRRRQSLANSERFTTDELADLADGLAQVEEAARAREQLAFDRLCARGRDELPALARLGEALAELDVLRSLAEVAHQGRYVRPQFTDRRRMSIAEGRHPVVEQTVDFVPNDLEMDEDTHLAVVTGPNMAGKSVFLRQTAVICLLAQLGSFVPAKRAELPILDRIYTRVGASDALAEGVSTFLAEMQEAAQIIAGASPRSLVILDELGRGTSTHDGMALAWAIARHLGSRIRCKTLFATHYRELAQLAEEVPGVTNLHVAVREWQGEVVFLHRVQPGVAERSYGVQVARLARLPASVLREAERRLQSLERTVAHVPDGAQQLPLFAPSDHPALTELRRVDPERLTPLEALQLLARLRTMLADQ
ncbi:MAG: DNA mismatch repair protein MutS [Candidatus Bipolaricaulaceae bacterium]